MELQIIRSRGLSFRRNQELVTKHKLLEKPLSHIVLREFVVHRSKYGGVLFVR
jgi:hypothetical protein